MSPATKSLLVVFLQHLTVWPPGEVAEAAIDKMPDHFHVKSAMVGEDDTGVVPVRQVDLVDQLPRPVDDLLPAYISNIFICIPMYANPV